MTDELNFPEFAWKERQQQLAIEVPIDLIPEQFHGKWLSPVRNFTQHWVKKNRFMKKGTLWIWGTLGANFGIPAWSEFLIQFGFPARYFTELEQHLESAFHRTRMEYVSPIKRDYGWAPVCHVEAQDTWMQVDEDTWIPLRPNR